MLLVDAEDRDGRTTALIHEPVGRRAERDVVQEREIDDRFRERPAEAAVDAGTQPDMIRNARRFEVRADIRLARIDRAAAGEPDP